jgi:hypothetical protein
VNFVFQKLKCAAVFLLLVAGEKASLGAGVVTNLPPPANVSVDFDRDVRPVFEASCFQCHGPQKPKSHFRLDFREAALAGGDENTNDIVPGDSGSSWLIAYVARQVPDMEMPPDGHGSPLSGEQIGLLRAWIDQGANWGTTNSSPAFQIDFAPTLRAFDVSGNKQKFREIQGAREGLSEGLDKFSITEQIDPRTRISLDGRVIVPNQDFDFKLALSKDDVGFIHAGFNQWRKYYATDGGFDPAVTPSQFNLNQDLHVDSGRAWVELGLELPRWPQIVLGYEYQYRLGTESTLDWGFANGKDIYPSLQSLDERTHIVKLDVTKNLGDWRLENVARIEIYSEKNSGLESAILLGGATPNETIHTHDDYHHVQGMDTFTVERQIREWWFLNGGFYYSYLSGSDFFNQITAIPAFSFNRVLSSQQITLNRESEIFSVANLFSPLDYLTLSVGTQNEWTREHGFSESVPDFTFGGTLPASSGLDEFKASQNANFRFTKIPFSVVFGDAQFSEDYYRISQAEDPPKFQRETDASKLRHDLKAGFSTSPWRWADLTAQYERQASDTDYRQLKDLFNGASAPTNGYPGFILGRRITSDQFETKLVLRPATWLKTTLTYQLASTDYTSRTDPAIDFFTGQPVSDGGFIADGHYDLHTYGISATVTPWRQLYITSAFTYSHSRAKTAANHDPSIAPYEGDIFTVYTTATYAVNDKTGVQLAYNFSHSNYAQNNGTAGVPAGLDYTRNDLIAGLTRKFTKSLAGAVHYEFSQYLEPSIGHINDFTAHGIFATVSYRWP